MPETPAPQVLPTASWPRRMLALLVDWFASSLVVIVIVGPERFFANRSTSGDMVPSLLTLAAFVLESALLTATSGGSFGKLATRLRVVLVDGHGRPPGILPALARSVLVALVIPPLVFRPDGRGLHDLMVGTATVTLQTAREQQA